MNAKHNVRKETIEHQEVVLTLSQEEAVKLYNITCFVNRAKKDGCIGEPTITVNSKLQTALFNLHINPDYDR